MEPDANANTMLVNSIYPHGWKSEEKGTLYVCQNPWRGSGGGQCCLGKISKGYTILAIFHPPYHPSPPVCFLHQCNEVSQGLSSIFSFSLAKAALPTNKKWNKMHKMEQNKLATLFNASVESMLITDGTGKWPLTNF
jgi:hypothetical protein